MCCDPQFVGHCREKRTKEQISAESRLPLQLVQLANYTTCFPVSTLNTQCSVPLWLHTSFRESKWLLPNRANPKSFSWGSWSTHTIYTYCGNRRVVKPWVLTTNSSCCCTVWDQILSSKKEGNTTIINPGEKIERCWAGMNTPDGGVSQVCTSTCS